MSPAPGRRLPPASRRRIQAGAFPGVGRPVTAAAFLALALSGCSTTSYYWQAVRGHLDLMEARRPIAEVIADPATKPELRERLKREQALRSFAITDLGLPDNGSYRSYAALDRPFVIWNVFAAPALSVDPMQWCFPIAGCVVYRGYFHEADADAEAEQLRQAGNDVYVGGVPAYSTLGWMDDPVLSTFIRWQEPELARLLFHELAHQKAYAKGDSAFNEAFATAVEEEGVKRWIAHDGRPALMQQWAEAQRHRKGFLQLVTEAREDLAALYAGPLPDDAKRQAKAARLAQLTSDYAALKAGWGGFAGYDRWFAKGVNNAQMASVTVYTAWVPAFEVMLHDDHDDLPAFYAHIKRLAQGSAEERLAAMTAARARATPD